MQRDEWVQGQAVLKSSSSGSSMLYEAAGTKECAACRQEM